MSSPVPQGNSTARLIFLSRAVEDLGLLLSSGDAWLSREECNAMAAESEVIVRALAACIEKHVPAVVIPMRIGDDSTIDQVVEFALEGIRKAFALIDRIVPEPSTK